MIIKYEIYVLIVVITINHATNGLEINSIKNEKLLRKTDFFRIKNNINYDLLNLNITSTNKNNSNNNNYYKNKNLNDIFYLNLSHKNLNQTNNNLNKLINLEYLDLSYNNLLNFNINFKKLKLLNLTHNNLNSFSDFFIKENINSLNLSYNNLSDINNLNFSSNQLEILDISFNTIKTINNNSNIFSKLKELKFLNLANNKIDNIPENLFKNLLKLETINLTFNNLISLKNNTFVLNNNLQKLDLSRNNLKPNSIRALQVIPNLIELSVAYNRRLGNALQGFVASWSLKEFDASGTGLKNIPYALTQSVRILKLRDNNFQIIHCGDLDSYPLLQFLILSSCLITDIEDDALGRLEILEELHLDNNKLSRIPLSLPSNLEKLFLQKNKIMDIQSTSFQQLSNLKILDLSENRITYLPDLPLLKLTSLNIKSNDLKGISQNTIKTSPNLKVLDLENNPVKCSDLFGIAEWAIPCRDIILYENTNYKNINSSQLSTTTTSLFYPNETEIISFSNITNLKGVDNIEIQQQLASSLKLETEIIHQKPLKDEIERGLLIQTTTTKTITVPVDKNINITAVMEDDTIQKIEKINIQNKINYIDKTTNLVTTDAKYKISPTKKLQTDLSELKSTNSNKNEEKGNNIIVPMPKIIDESSNDNNINTKITATKSLSKNNIKYNLSNNKMKNYNKNKIINVNKLENQYQIDTKLTTISASKFNNLLDIMTNKWDNKVQEEIEEKVIKDNNERSNVIIENYEENYTDNYPIIFNGTSNDNVTPPTTISMFTLLTSSDSRSSILETKRMEIDNKSEDEKNQHHQHYRINTEKSNYINHNNSLFFNKTTNSRILDSNQINNNNNSPSYSTLPQKWNEIRPINNRHSGTFFIVGATIGIILSISLVQIYRFIKPNIIHNINNANNSSSSIIFNRNIQNLHDYEQYSPINRDILPMESLNLSSSSSFLSPRHTNTNKYW